MSFTDNEVVPFVRAHKLVTIIVLICIVVLARYVAGDISSWWQSRQVNKQDQKLEQQIDDSEKAAAASESNANTHRDTRLAGEGRYQRAREEQQAAAQNSNRSAEEVRKARERYEETRRHRTADTPALSDAELCAELTKRGIDCR